MIICHFCACKPAESKRDFFPIDPRGAYDRRWACRPCLKEKEKKEEPENE